MVITNGAFKLMRDWAVVREYSLSSDWDNRWRIGGAPASGLLCGMAHVRFLCTLTVM